MALKMRSSEEDLRRAFERWYQTIIDNIAEALLYVCTEAVNRARATDTYKDQTNNLRSSIGFVIYYNGQKLFRDFKKSGTGTGGGGDISGQQGQVQGESLADKVSSKFPSGFVAVIVAGMNYALYVEAKGFDVITGSTLDIGQELNEFLQTISSFQGVSFGAQNQNDNQ
jgi:hypothetical protein